MKLAYIILIPFVTTFIIILLIVCVVTSAIHSTNFLCSHQYSDKAGAEQPRNCSLDTWQGQICPFLWSIQTSLEAHLASSSVDTVPLGKATGASCAKVKNEWSHTSTSLMCLHGMNRVNFLCCIMCVGMLCNRSLVVSIFYLFVHVRFLKLVTNFCQATW
jgi:hypothetical protein